MLPDGYKQVEEAFMRAVHARYLAEQTTPEARPGVEEQARQAFLRAVEVAARFHGKTLGGQATARVEVN